MSTTYETALSMRTICCWSCMAVYALAARFCERAEQDGQGWRCPHCQSSTAFKDSENKRLAAQLEQALKQKQYWEERKREVEKERDRDALANEVRARRIERYGGIDKYAPECATQGDCKTCAECGGHRYQRRYDQ